MTSVRGDRTVYRERETDYEDAPRRSYTTIKRYQVPESITRSVFNDDDVDVKEKVTVRRERREDPPPERDDVVYRVRETVRERDSAPREREDIDIRITERERDPPRREIPYRVVERERESDYERPRSEFRVVERERSNVRAPSPPSGERVREYRWERERSFSPPPERDYDVERYSKSTEYFAQPQPAPRPIVIRESAPQAPQIIIQERRQAPQQVIIRREEPQYEFIERREVEETTKEDVRSEVTKKSETSKSLVKREEPPPPAPVPEQKPEEDYFYERRIVERRRRSPSDDRRSEIRPRDSASQYSSDDSYEYVRREKITEEGGRERDRSPNHRRHLAEGAIAGIGAAEIIRHHRKQKGENTGGRGKSVIGGAALGAVGAEALSRVRSMRSLRERSRSRSDERSDRRDRDRRKRRSRSRSKSLSRAQTLGGIAAVAAVGALAGYALNKKRGGQETIIVNDRSRRSRSRRRRSSVGPGYDDDRGPDDDKHRDPEHRNRRIAQAGLASAAAAGILERMRSRSRGGRNRSQGRIQQGIPIAAAGLGGAALAGLYEKNKANKEAKRDGVIQDEIHRGRRRRSRSRSAAASYPGDDRRGGDDRGLIEYGDGAIYPDARRDYYDDEAPGSYRRRGGSSGSSPDTRRRRSRSRPHGRHLAETGAAAGAAGIGAYELGRRHEAGRAERDHRGHDNRYGGQPYSPTPAGNSQFLPPQSNAYAHQAPESYPGGAYFPPPPTGDFSREAPAEPNAAYPAYNPADYAGQAASHQQPYNAPHGAYGDSEANLGQGYPTDTFAGDTRFDAHEPHPQATDGRRGRDPENVSTPPSEAHAVPASQSADGVETPPRARSTSRVRFDLDSNTLHSPDARRRKDDSRRGPTDSPDGHGSTRDANDDGDDDGRRHRHRRRNKGKERARDDDSLMHDRYDRSPDRGSEGTADSSEHFDEQGNRKHSDPLADKINDLLTGRGGAGGIFKSLTEGILGGGSGGGGSDRGDDRGDDDGGRSGRRRHRRSLH